ncbi:hypothetical protein MFIFM68171_10697 [Madurella fahalii]|uniref:AB hydrolase-1 domain-containing protein n=1 Tax=Madurella fahalii TaxID=1157608 RepID=A0ABQ0GS01_9PEZI
MADKLTPTDPRVQHRTFTVPNTSKTYHYLLAEPPSGTAPVATCLLIHGFPDLSFGWRCQIPHLAGALSLRVIAPDLPGYGGSSAPAELSAYSFKSVVDDLASLVRHVLGPDAEGEGEKIVLGGHDWGGAVAWRFALWRPDLLRCVFSVCTPYWPPSPVYLPKEEVVKRLPNFGYQLQWEGHEVERAAAGKEGIRGFLNICYGARGKNGEAPLFDPTKGVRLDLVERGMVGESPLMSKEEMDFYVEEYARKGMKWPLNWYRTDKVNFEEEVELVKAERFRIKTPALMVTASADQALPPTMAAAMDEYCDDLVTREVNASHWVLWEKPAEVNAHISEFLERFLKEGPLKASI